MGGTSLFSFVSILRDRRGTALVEFTLIVWLLYVLTFGIVDVALAVWNHNMASKAAHEGARVAVQSDPLDSAFATWNAVVDGGYATGQSLDTGTLAAFTVRCTDTGCSCIAGSCPSGFGGAVDATAYARVVDAMAVMFPRVTEAGVTVYVDYSHVGLGFAGRPGPDVVPHVAVGMTGLTHDFHFLGFVGLNSMTMGEFRTSLPGEDLATTWP